MRLPTERKGIDIALDLSRCTYIVWRLIIYYLTSFARSEIHVDPAAVDHPEPLSNKRPLLTWSSVPGLNHFLSDARRIEPSGANPPKKEFPKNFPRTSILAS